MTTSSFRIPESEVAFAFGAMAQFKDALLRGAASPSVVIDDAVVVFTLTEIVAGPRAKLRAQLKEPTAAQMVFGKHLRVSYADLYEIFFGDQCADEMQQAMGLTVVMMRHADQAAGGGYGREADQILQAVNAKYLTPMYQRAMAYINLASR